MRALCYHKEKHDVAPFSACCFIIQIAKRFIKTFKSKGFS